MATGGTARGTMVLEAKYDYKDAPLRRAAFWLKWSGHAVFPFRYMVGIYFSSQPIRPCLERQDLFT